MEKDSGESVLAENVCYLYNETPKLETAVKNLISVIVGKAAVESDSVFDATDALHCARIMLKTMQEVSLSPLTEWSNAHPQSEQQNGLARLEICVKYRAAQYAQERIRSTGEKLTKQFGKSYLIWSQSWDEIFATALHKCRNGEAVSETLLVSFFTKFEHSLKDSSENTPNHWADDEDLIWTCDFAGALKSRQQLRARKAQDQAEGKFDYVENFTCCDEYDESKLPTTPDNSNDT